MDKETSSLAAVARAATETAKTTAIEPAAAVAAAPQTAAQPAAATAAAAVASLIAPPVDASAAVDAAKKRIASIIALPEAKGRESLAQELALTTDVTPEQAAKLLAAAPVAGATGVFQAAMRATGNPSLGTGAQGPGAQGDGKATPRATLDYGAIYGRMNHPKR